MVIFIAGYFGLLLGVGVIEGMNSALGGSDFFKNPGVDLTVALVSFTVMLVFGLLVGLFPAYRAMRIKAVDALRADR